jgi:hypothetical protein
MMILNYGRTNAARHFFSHFSNCVSLLQRREISSPLGPFHMSILIMERVGMHISNLDWRRTKTWDTPEKQLTSVSESVFMSRLSLPIFFGKTVKKNCQTQGIGVLGKISFFKKIVSDDCCARYV